MYILYKNIIYNTIYNIYIYIYLYAIYFIYYIYIIYIYIIFNTVYIYILSIIYSFSFCMGCGATFILNFHFGILG